LVRDVVETNILAINNRANSISNIGTDEETTVNKLFNLPKEITDFPAQQLHGLPKEGE